MLPEMFVVLNHSFIGLGICMNLLALVTIACSTPRTLKDYSIILFNTAVNDLLQLLLHFLMNPRLFASGSTLINMADGPCRLVHDYFCGLLFVMIQVSAVHTSSLIAISFWYR
ncbi:hypothetical protein PMAYCL1PPCAC_26182, partial [Pristionchus mayeri]